MRLDRSRAAMQAALEVIPGGVNSPVRAFRGVGGDPVFFERAAGAYVWDVDGNKYVDYVGSWGPAILGHAHPEVVKAAQAALENGFSFGAPTEAETELARAVRTLVPSMELVRFVSSGTEACMSALRVARAATKRDKILKFTGCYHGHADALLVKAGSGALTLGLPDSPGVPADATKHTLLAPFNDLEAVTKAFAEAKGAGGIAAIILEPIVGNAGFIRPEPGFLEGLRALCTKEGALLVFDEVMTGFRVHPGGVQALAKITPDLTTLGKVIGGGMPIGAYGGRRDIMSLVAPAGPVYQAGTLSGNPVAVASGLKTLEVLTRPGVFDELRQRTSRLVKGFETVAKKRGVPLTTDCEGGMFGFFFRGTRARSLEEAKDSDLTRFKAFFHAMLAKGVYLAPSAFEAGFVSTAHTDADVDHTVAMAEAALADIG